MSTWNMPPGVTTNDIPGNESDEQLRQLFIEDHEDAAETIAQQWISELRFEDQDSAMALLQDDLKRRRESLRIQLVFILRANLNEFELAENAGDGFEAWMESQ